MSSEHNSLSPFPTFYHFLPPIVMPLTTSQAKPPESEEVPGNKPGMPSGLFTLQLVITVTPDTALTQSACVKPSSRPTHPRPVTQKRDQAPNSNDTGPIAQDKADKNPVLDRASFAAAFQGSKGCNNKRRSTFMVKRRLTRPIASRFTRLQTAGRSPRLRAVPWPAAGRNRYWRRYFPSRSAVPSPSVPEQTGPGRALRT